MNQYFLTEMFTSESISLARAAVSLPIAFALGYFISWIYRRTHKGFSYSGAFNLTLIMVTVIVAIVMMSIASNIALSLGLIGSLSIIRFRTALKDTTDICYVFWGIAEGLAVGAHSFLFAVVTTLFVGMMVVLLSKHLFRRLQGNDYVVIVQLEPDSETSATESVVHLFDEKNLSWKIRSSEIDNATQKREIVYQVNERDIRDCSCELLDRLQATRGINKVSLLSSEVNLFV